MKRIAKSLLIGGFLIFAGCSAHKEVSKKEIKLIKECKIQDKKAPLWICNNIDDKENIYGVGSAGISPLGETFQRAEAAAIARDEIARKIEVRVKNLIKRYYSSTGTKDSQTAERVVTAVSKQISHVALKGSSIERVWKAPDGTMYVLVKMPRDKIKDAVIQVRNKMKQDEILWQEYKADKAFKELEKEL